MEKKAFPSLFALVGLLSEFGAGVGNREFVHCSLGFCAAFIFSARNVLRRHLDFV